MCMIVVKPENVPIPKKKYLQSGYRENPNGVGIAVLKPNAKYVFIKKDFSSFKKFYKWIKYNIKIEDILIVHFRYATSGLIDNGNRHPFPIVKKRSSMRKTEMKCNMAFAHNGVLDNHEELDSVYSDTQNFIKDILYPIKDILFNDAIIDLLEHYLEGDRGVILDNRLGLVCFLGEWIEDERCFWSNEDYKKKKRNYKSKITIIENSSRIIKKENNLIVPSRQRNVYMDYPCECCGKYDDVQWDRILQKLLCWRCRIITEPRPLRSVGP